jgi:putative ABC transport system permease protein
MVQPDWHALIRARLPQLTREVADEIAQHLGDLYVEAVRAGASAQDAGAIARSALDDEAALLEDPTAVRREVPAWQLGQSAHAPVSMGGAMLVNLRRDLRYATRMLRRQPAFALVTIVTLTLGIGVNVAVFSMMRAALLASLPLPRPDRLVSIYSWTVESGDHADFSYPLYVDARDKGAALADIAAYTAGSVGIATTELRDRALAEFTTSNYFNVLGVRMRLGPGFSGPDERRGAPLVAVISDRLWRSMFSAADDIVGRSFVIDGTPCAIVGVAPGGFGGFVRGQRADLWVPLNHYFPLEHRPDMLDRRTTSWMSLLGRLRDGATAPQLQAALTTALRPQIAAEEGTNWSIRARTASAGDMSLVTDLGRPLQLLMIVVGIILVITAANVANLLLARSYSRQGEIAMRQSLGASRARIVQQLLVEAAVLGAAGAVCALAAGIWAARLFELRPAFDGSALALSIGPDRAVIAFTVAVAAIASLAIGLIPAVGIRNLTPAGVIKAAGHGSRVAGGRGRLRGALTVVQIALSLVLVIGAGLFLRSLAKIRSVDRSLITDRTIAATFNTALRGYDEARGRQFYDAVLAAVSSRPGIESAALAFVLPVTAGGMRTNLPARSTTPAVDSPVEYDMVPVSPGFFHTTNLALVRGRDFSPADAASAPAVIIVNERMNARFWPEIDPVGQTFKAGETDSYTVIGVARDTKYRSFREAPRMTMYLPLAQSYESSVNLVVRSALPADTTVTSLRAAVRSVDPAMPLYNVRTMAEHVERSLYLDRIRARLIAWLAALALALAAVGIYGVVSYNVTQRTREVGIRLALGAEPREILVLLVGGGARLALAGVIVGAALSMWLTRGIAAQLYGITPADPVALGGAAAALFGVVLVATYLPARRATKIDPMCAVRAE